MTLNQKLFKATGIYIMADECEKIADDYAIDFAEWMAKEYWLNSSGKHLKSTKTKQLLEIFKKEKGL